MERTVKVWYNTSWEGPEPPTNIEDMALLSGYRAHHELRLALEFEVPWATGNDAADAELVFAMLNDDNRLNQHDDRSLSVGDVVEFLDTGARWACESLGWRSI